jgi:hypothetical protein
MILVAVTIIVCAALVGVLFVYLLTIGILLNRIADNLDDALGNVKTIAQQAEPVIPSVEHINRTGGVVAGALPLLYGHAERIITKVSAPTPAPVNGHTNVPASGRRRSRLMDTVGFRSRHH